MKLKLLIIGLFVLGFAFTSQAQTKKAPRIVKTQLKQQQQIQHGIKSGKLTKKEAVKLQKQQRLVSKAKRKAKGAGVFTPKEKINLTTRQDRARTAIFKKKHNNKVCQ